jgi:hypothetical protein
MSTLDDFFTAFRNLKREQTNEGLSQADVDAVNAIIAGWKKPAKTTGLADPEKFFKAVRDFSGGLTQTQVDGFNRILGAFGAAGSPIAYVAYGLATTWWEGGKGMVPVEEGYYLGDRGANFRRNLRYWPWYGRGDVQLTWKQNYERADRELGLNGALVANPALALRPDISAKVLVQGMTGGWFSGKAFKDYLPDRGKGDIHEFANARRIINGQDKAIPIADLAMKFQDALEAGGWS